MGAPQNPILKLQKPSVIIFGDEVYMGIIKCKWGHKACSNRTGILIRKDRVSSFSLPLHQEKAMGGHTEKVAIC